MSAFLDFLKEQIKADESWRSGYIQGWITGYLAACDNLEKIQEREDESDS